jgi:O-antigen ligase
VSHPAYEPLLRETGWKFDRTLARGLDLWRQDRVWPVAPWALARAGPTPAARWWGVAPLAALALAAGAAALDDERLRAALGRTQALLLAGIVLIFPIGWHEVVHVSRAPGVFLTYRGVLVFASDSVMFSLVLAWLAGRWLYPGRARPLRLGPPAIGLAWAGLALAVALSVPRSTDPWLSTAFFAHLVLLGGFYVYLQTEPGAWRLVMALFIVQLGLQGALGLLEFATQATTVLGPMRLPFVAAITADVPGASVVQTADGTRWLRAYGTLWHPNVLGAVVLLCLAGPAWLAIKGKGGKNGNEGNEGTRGTSVPAGKSGRAIHSLSSRVSLSSPISLISLVSLLSFAIAFSTLALSFSRSAWVGAGVAGALLLARLPRPAWRRLWPAAVAGAVTLALVVVPYRALFFTRATADARSPLERYSVEERASVARVALDLAGEHLLTGVGAGAFVQAMAADPGITVTREPVHNVPLLVLAETGLPGALALAALALAVGLEFVRRWPSAEAHVMGAVLAGLLATMLFDHFLWSSSPGRSIAVLALGLWAAAGRAAGQGGDDGSAAA